MKHEREPWRDQALCRGIDPELFYPERGESTREAKAVCAQCPVVEPCLDYALRTREVFGIWGGVAERERRTMRARKITARAHVAARATNAVEARRLHNRGWTIHQIAARFEVSARAVHRWLEDVA